RVCASFLVRVMVQDVNGQSDFASIPLTVECERIQLISRSLPAVRRGGAVDLQLVADVGDVSYQIVQGYLPQGLVLEEDGRVHGTVDAGAAFGTYPFGVRIRDEEGRQGASALSIEVLVDPAPLRSVKQGGGGCSSGGGG